MKKLTNQAFYLSILIISFIACKTETQIEIENLEQLKTEKIDSLGKRYLELNRFSGTILVAKNETIIYNQNFGLADYENEIPFTSKTAFKIGEITELITDNLLNKLVKEGKIESSDKLSKYLKGIESGITINEILNKKSGFDYNAIGRLIEQISNKSYQKNIEEYSNDLELENTHFKKKGVTSSVGYLYHNYRGNGLELQKAPSYDLENAFSSKGLKSTAKDLLKILNSQPKELRIDGYLGNDGFSYSVVNKKTNGISIIVLSNRRHPVTSEIMNSIDAIIKNKEYKLPFPRKPFNIEKTSLSNFTGNYSLNENVNFEVLNSNDSLFVLMGSNKTYLVPQSTNQFYMQHMDASMRFLRDSTKQVNRILLLNGFIDSEQIAMRIR